MLNIHALLLALGLLLMPSVSIYSQEASQTKQEQTEAPQKPKRSSATGKQEDLARFFGYENLLERYTTLPYDKVMNTNWTRSYLDIGFMLLALIPLLFLFGGQTPIWLRIAYILFLFSWMFFASASAYINKNNLEPATALDQLKKDQAADAEAGNHLAVLNHRLRKPALSAYQSIYPFLQRISGERDGITYPVLCTLLFLGFLGFMPRIAHHNLATQATLLILLLYGFLWILLSSGIPWYGLLILPLGLVFVIRGAIKSGRFSNFSEKIGTVGVLGLSALWLFLFIPLRLCDFSPHPEFRGKYFLYPEIAQYQTGRFTASQTIDQLYPAVLKAEAHLNADDEAMIYRIGTFLPFFIEKNDRRVFSDSYLDFFSGIRERYPDKNILGEVLKAYGFKFIILDLNLVNIDLTSEKTLTDKFNNFINFLYRNPYVELITTDRKIKLDRNGTVLEAVFAAEGYKIEKQGRFALYRIK